MNPADAKTVTEKLGSQPVFACAGDCDDSALVWAKKDGFHHLQLGVPRKAVTGHRLLHGRLQLPRRCGLGRKHICPALPRRASPYVCAPGLEGLAAPPS